MTWIYRAVSGDLTARLLELSSFLNLQVTNLILITSLLIALGIGCGKKEGILGGSRKIYM